MPSYSIVHAPVICPNCGREVTYRAGETAFSWGRTNVHYWGLDVEIEWLRDRRGAIVPPFKTYRPRGWFGLRDPQFNFGSPEHPNVVALDPEIGMWPLEGRICPNCLSRYDHIAVVVRDGRLSEVKVFAEGEIASTFGPLGPLVGTVLVRPDGSHEPRPDWDDMVTDPYEERGP